MKQFMMIFIGANYSAVQLSANELQEQMRRWYKWIDKMKLKAQYVEGHALTGPTGRVVEKNWIILDNCEDQSEIVSGYCIIKAANLKEAAEIAASYPDFDLGGKVELREVLNI